MKSFLIIALVGCVLPLFAQHPDSTLYKSEFEKVTLKNFIDQNGTNPIDLFLCIDNKIESSEQHNAKIENFIRTELKGIEGKKLKKQVKLIYNSTHNYFLNMYDEEAFFSDIFTSGKYNCVTASALYSLILEHFDIPYVIKETPQHVYLIAQPSGNHILIESTLPSKGTFRVDDRYKKNYINYLTENKIIAQSEYETLTIDELFEKYYDENKTITLSNLAGIQYYNKGILLYDKADYISAVNSLEKAFLLYSSNSIKFSYHQALLTLMQEQDKNRTYSGKTLAKFMDINSISGEAETFALDYFNRMTNEYAINHPQPDKFEAFYTELHTNISDTVKLKTIEQSYFYYQGYTYYANQNHSMALKSLKNSYRLNPENINTKQLIKEVAIKHIMTDRNREQEIDSLSKYFNQFPFLFEIDVFQDYYTYCYLRTISELINRENITKAFNYLDEFEEIIKQNPDIIIRDEYVTAAYGEIAAYFVRNTNYDRAENYFLKGLELAPDSYDLQQGLKLLIGVKDDLNKYIKENKSSENSYTVLPVQKTVNSGSTFKQDIEKYLPGTWVAEYYIYDGKKESLPKNEKMIFIATSNKKLTLDYGMDKESGRWAIRSKEKLLYWVYSEDNSDYEVFKVLEINDSRLKIQYYEGNELQDEIIVFSR